MIASGFDALALPLDETDWADVSALCERFGLAVPSDYARFR